MDWEECTYKQIAELISDTDIEKMIDVMVANCDINGNFYESYKVEDFIKSHVHNSEIINLIDETARKEIKSTRENDKDSLAYLILDDLNIKLRKEQICENILCQIAKEARNKRYDRVFTRLHAGDNISLNSYDHQYSFLENIEFLKDGGWGIANKEGHILIGNHIIQRPSKTKSLFNKRNCPYRLIQDRDTELYGVLSFQTFREVIHCLYDKIEVVEYWQGNNKKFILKTKKNDKWGCYDEKCVLIVDCKYDEIYLTSGWIECCRDGIFLHPEIDYNKYGSIYEGVKDLYDTEGKLMLGGYNYFEYEYGQYFKFYFGTKHEEFFVKQTDFYDNEIELSRYKLNFDNSVCLILDRHFRTITKCNGHFFQVPLGKVFKSLQDTRKCIPIDFHLKGKVDLADINNLFVYSINKYKDRYLVSTFIKGSDEKGPFGDWQSVPSRWIDYYVEDDIIILIKLSTEYDILWERCVNEIGKTEKGLLLYRIGEKSGFYTEKGLCDAIYSAITTDDATGKNYYAIIDYLEYKRDSSMWWTKNCNYVNKNECLISYYEIDANGILMKIEDDWNVFNPKKHKWFPADFLEKNGLVDYDSMGCYEGKSGLSYEKYGGHNGYNDDTIDYGFDGFPEATWNVD